MLSIGMLKGLVEILMAVVEGTDYFLCFFLSR